MKIFSEIKPIYCEENKRKFKNAPEIKYEKPLIWLAKTFINTLTDFYIQKRKYHPQYPNKNPSKYYPEAQ